MTLIYSSQMFFLVYVFILQKAGLNWQLLNPDDGKANFIQHHWLLRPDGTYLYCVDILRTGALILSFYLMF